MDLSATILAPQTSRKSPQFQEQDTLFDRHESQVSRSSNQQSQEQFLAPPMPQRRLLRLLAFSVIDIGKPLIRRGRSLKSPALRAWLPEHNLLDLLGKLKILIRNPFGSMVLKPDFDPSVGGGYVGMVPGSLGKMSDRVDHHERTLPACGPIFAADPSALIDPSRKFLLETRLNLGLTIGLLPDGVAHCSHPIFAGVSSNRLRRLASFYNEIGRDRNREIFAAIWPYNFHRPPGVIYLFFGF
jgi:hypothetical protein